MFLSVVIGAYNQKNTLKRVLESLANQTLPANQYEIVVVDSFSSDGTDAMVEQLTFPCSFTYLRQENRGKSVARNRGIKEAKGEIIFLTDADMVADKNLLSEHLQAHRQAKNSAFEGLTINPDGKPYIRQKLRPRQRLRWSYFLTGNLSVKKATVVAAGRFDENFSGYGWEDLELGYRLHQMKIPLIYLPAAINYHYHPVSDEDMLRRKYEMGKSAALFYKKHPNLEIKYFLGMNPLAMGIYRYLKRKPKIIEYLSNRVKRSHFFQYLLEEYYYRKGLEESLV